MSYAFLFCFDSLHHTRRPGLLMYCKVGIGGVCVPEELLQREDMSDTLTTWCYYYYYYYCYYCSHSLLRVLPTQGN